jgi:hypothetical protein
MFRIFLSGLGKQYKNLRFLISKNLGNKQTLQVMLARATQNFENRFDKMTDIYFVYLYFQRTINFFKKDIRKVAVPWR